MRAAARSSTRFRCRRRVTPVSWSSARASSSAPAARNRLRLPAYGRSRRWAELRRQESQEAGMEIAGRVAVVTGASSGIGATVATDLARRGATVAAVARRKDKLDEIVDQCRQFAAASMAAPADISSRDECERVIAEVEERFGRVDVVVNNAGISIHRNAARTTADDVERLMAVHFFAPVYLTTAAMAGMLERKP